MQEFGRATRGVWQFACIGSLGFGEFCEFGEGAGLIHQVGNCEEALLGRL